MQYYFKIEANTIRERKGLIVSHQRLTCEVFGPRGWKNQLNCHSLKRARQKGTGFGEDFIRYNQPDMPII